MTHTTIIATLAACAAAALASCTGQATGNAAGTDSISTCPDTVTAVADTTAAVALLPIEHLSWNDSTISRLNNRSYCHIEVDYPTDGTLTVTDSIRRWIASQFDYFNYTGDLADGRRLIAEAGRSFIDNAKTDFAGFDTLDIQNQTYADDYTISPLYESDSTITYANAMYWDRGGAHGASPFRVAVFNRNDGRSLSWDMFLADRLDTVRAIVREAIKVQHFETDSEEEFKDMLMTAGADEFPLSAQPPYFMADGVHVVYQQYEIAPYVSGLPGCVIPYSTLYHYFTPEVRRLLPTAQISTAN